MMTSDETSTNVVVVVYVVAFVVVFVVVVLVGFDASSSRCCRRVRLRKA